MASRLFGLTAGALLLVTTGAAAQTTNKDKGIELARQGVELYQQEKYADAYERFKDAEKYFPTAQVLRMEGYSLIALKRYLEAAEALERALKTDMKPLEPADAEDTEDHLNELKKKQLATVTIKSDVKTATVKVDDGPAKPVPQTLLLLPGGHHFVIEAPKHDTIDEARDLPVGETTLTFNPKEKRAKAEPVTTEKPKPEPEPKPSKPANIFGWFPHQREVGIALEAAGFAAGMVGLGLGVYGLRLNSAVQTNIDAHNANYDANCSTFTDLCLNDIALVNRDGVRAAQLRNAGMATGLAGLGVFAVGAVFMSFAADGPFAPKKGADKAGAEGAECGVGLAALSCSGRF